MGYFSERSIEIWDQRLQLDHIEDRRICASCFGDSHLGAFFRDHDRSSTSLTSR